MKLTKDTLIEGQIIRRGTEVKINEVDYKSLKIGRSLLDPASNLAYNIQKIDWNKDWILDQREPAKKGFRGYNATEDLFQWIDNTLLGIGNLFDGIDLINNVLDTEF
ncbi:MAG: hypothetical protein PF569_07780 [Candidatus Woesearchaeota archaeon]|jgi:hypothetical protein|nr:hypothetical protein [Candidatus Woesearchaeota archaeon]